jgi:hypothetical protein
MLGDRRLVATGPRGRSSRSSSIFVVGLVATMLMVWFERKVISDMQNRIGPNKAGPLGSAADARRRHQAVLQGRPDPREGDRFVFKLAPYLAFVPAFLVWSVIPLGGDFNTGNDGTRHDPRRPPRACSSPIRRWGPVVAGAQLDRRVRHHARRLGVGLEVPAARLGASVGADGQLRGGARPELAAVLLIAGTLDQRHRDAQDGFTNWHLVAPASCRS